ISIIDFALLVSKVGHRPLLSTLRLLTPMNSSYASPLALFSKHPQTSLWELESIHDIVGRPLSTQYFIISANSAGTAFLFISSYTDINTISGKSSFPIFHIHAATSGDIIPVIGHAFISGVVTIAAL